MNRLLYIIICLTCFSASLSVKAESSIDTDSLATLRPVTSTYSIRYGYASTIDTYLSPMRYDGSTIAITGTWLKAMRQNPRRLIMAFDSSIDFANQLSPAQNSKLYDLGYNFAWSMLYRWNPIKGFQVAAGGGTSLNFGARYLSRNSNNPISARASIDITANAMATYSLKIGHTPIRFIDRISAPVIGAFFSPEYGETYYEIYLGNYSGLVHCGWWGNNFRISNLLAADISLGSVAIRIGYQIDFSSSLINNINTRHTSHSVVVGLTHDNLNITSTNKTCKTIPSIF